MEKYHLKSIPVNQIRASGRFCLRYSLQDALLESWVKRVGYLKPICLSKENEIISGYKRYHIAVQSREPMLNCLVLNEAVGDKDLFYLAMLSNWNQSWSDLDRAFVLQKAAHQFAFEREELAMILMPLLSMDPSERLMEQYLTVIKYPQEILNEVAKGHAPLRGLYKFSWMGEADLRFLGEGVIANAALTSSDLMLSAEWLYDLLKISCQSLDSFLKESNLISLLVEPKRDRKSKGQELMVRLRKLRYPRMSAYEERFMAARSQLCVPQKGIQVDSSPSFEEEGYTIKAKLRDPVALENFLEWLQTRKSSLNSLFDIML